MSVDLARQVNVMLEDFQNRIAEEACFGYFTFKFCTAIIIIILHSVIWIEHLYEHMKTLDFLNAIAEEVKYIEVFQLANGNVCEDNGVDCRLIHN